MLLSVGRVCRSPKARSAQAVIETMTTYSQRHRISKARLCPGKAVVLGYWHANSRYLRIEERLTNLRPLTLPKSYPEKTRIKKSMSVYFVSGTDKAFWSDISCSTTVNISHKTEITEGLWTAPVLPSQ